MENKILFSGVLIAVILMGGLTACSGQDGKPAEETEEATAAAADLPDRLPPLQSHSEAIKKSVLKDVVDADTISVGHVEKTDEEWKAELTEAEYYILRERGTEPAFKNPYYDKKTEGIYYCAACGLPLYSSKTKFHSGTGWPSYWAPIDPKLVDRRVDPRFGIPRIEVVCAQCGSHLGHIFTNNTVPSGERHCLNSLALDFRAQEL